MPSGLALKIPAPLQQRGQCWPGLQVKPLVPKPISAALLALPKAPHIPASHSYSDMISLEKHGMNFSQQVINSRTDFLVYQQRVDGAPREGRNMGGFLSTGSTSRVSTVGDK